MAEWGGDDRSPTIKAVVWSLTTLSTVSVALRIISRTAFGSNILGLDDFFSVFSSAIMLADAIAISLAVDSGVGKHIWNIPPMMVPDALKRTIIANSIVVWAFTMPKFALIALLRRLFPIPKWQSRLLWGIAIVNQCGILATSVLWFTRCRPVAKSWDSSLPGECDSFSTLGYCGYVTASISSFLDLLFALYPIYPISKLQMSRQKKIAICCSLGLGIFGCAVSVYKIIEVTPTLPIMPIDPTYAIVPIMMFGNAEGNILVLAASLPALGPLIRWVVHDSPLARKKYKLSNTDAQPKDMQQKEMRPIRRRVLPGQSETYTQMTDNSLFQTDHIPLVPVSDGGQAGRGRSSLPAHGGITRTVQVSVQYS